MTKIYLLRLAALIVTVSLLAAGLPAQVLAAVNSTTVGGLTLVPGVENISVYASFSGDEDGDNHAVLEYRKAGAFAWKPGIDMTPDRRQQYSRYQMDAKVTRWYDNPYKNQWRAIVFWLTPDTEYEVRVTYTDPDGGGGSVTGSVRTLPDNPPSTGPTYYVSTTGSDSADGLSPSMAFATIAHAGRVVPPGAVVKLMPGTHRPPGRTNPLTAAGLPDNYITFESQDPANRAVIANDRWLVSGSYLRIRNLEFAPSAALQNIVLRGSHHIIVEDCVLNLATGADWNWGGPPSTVTLDGVQYAVIQRNMILSDDLRQQKFGLYSLAANSRSVVIRGNTFSGYGMKDAISGQWFADTFIYDNHVGDTWDDSLEVEGLDMNIAVWGNTTAGGAMALGMAPVAIGPYYIFRNVFYGFRDAALKMGNSSGGATYVYHNTIYNTRHVRGIATFGNNAKLNNLVMRNNIVVTGYYVIDSSDPDPAWNYWDLDYDLLVSHDSAGFSKWRVGQVNAQRSLGEFRQALATHPGPGYPNEAHGISADPQFSNPGAADFTLRATSPAVDSGVILPGFNDANSPWPYSGSAPDIGAFEYGTEGPTNRAPVLGLIGNKSVEAGQLLEFTVSATDVDGDTLTYAASNLPAGASFDPQTGTFSWTPDTGQAGDHTGVRFQVSDGSLIDSESITITVNAQAPANSAPVLGTIGDRSVEASQELSFVITATDDDNDTLTFSASNLPAGASFDPQTGTFSWTPDTGQAGDHSGVRFEVSDGSLTDSEDITITVTAPEPPPNAAPVLGTIGDKSVNEGELLAFTVSGTDPDGDQLTFAATNLPAGASFNAATRAFSWTPASEQVGTHANIGFQVSDGSLTDTEAITITVKAVNEAPVLTGIGAKSVDAGTLLEFAITASDADGDQLSYSASNLPPGSSFDPQTRTFSWTPTLSQGGVHGDVRFEVSDGDLADFEEIAITVLTDVNTAPVLNAIGDHTVTEGELLQFTVTAADPEGDPLLFSASNLPPGASFDADTATFSWTPEQGQAGVYSDVRFGVADDGALADVEHVTITVEAAAGTGGSGGGGGGGIGGDTTLPANQAPELEAIGHKEGSVGSHLSFVLSASDPDGDELTFSAVNLPEGASLDAATGVFSWTPATGEAGTFSVSFRVSDGDLTDSEKVDIAVDNGDAAPPQVTEVVAAGVRTTTAEIHWTTDEPSTSQVEYWASPSTLTPIDEALVTHHTVLLTGLTPGVQYSYKTVSRDATGNVSESPVATFTTPGAETSFTVSGLTVTPAEAEPGEDVLITVLVRNIGDVPGSHEVVLTVDGVREVSQNVVGLAAGAGQKAAFIISRDSAGTHAVDVNGLAGSIVVGEKALSGTTIADFGVTPSYDADTGVLRYAAVQYDLGGEAAGEVTVELRVLRDGRLLEEIVLLSTTLTGTESTLSYDYAPSGGWTEGTYTFTISGSVQLTAPCRRRLMSSCW